MSLAAKDRALRCTACGTTALLQDRYIHLKAITNAIANGRFLLPLRPVVCADTGEVEEKSLGHLYSNRNPLDDVPCHLPLPAVIEPRRPRVGMASQVLHVFERHTLSQQIGDGRHAE